MRELDALLGVAALPALQVAVWLTVALIHRGPPPAGTYVVLALGPFLTAVAWFALPNDPQLASHPALGDLSDALLQNTLAGAEMVVVLALAGLSIAATRGLVHALHHQH